MKPAELAALGLRLAALVLQIQGVMWGCAFVPCLIYLAYTMFGHNRDWSLMIVTATGIPTGMYLLSAWYFRRRAEKIVACPPGDAAASPDRCTAEILIAVLVAWGAFTIVEPLRTLVVEWLQTAEYRELSGDWVENTLWQYRVLMQAFDVAAPLVCLCGATVIVRCILWLKRPRAAVGGPIDA